MNMFGLHNALLTNNLELTELTLALRYPKRNAK